MNQHPKSQNEIPPISQSLRMPILPRWTRQSFMNAEHDKQVKAFASIGRNVKASVEVLLQLPAFEAVIANLPSSRYRKLNYPLGKNIRGFKKWRKQQCTLK